MGVIAGDSGSPKDSQMCTPECGNEPAVSAVWCKFTDVAVSCRCCGAEGKGDRLCLARPKMHRSGSGWRDSHIPACPAGSWTCSSFASVPVAVLIFPWMALPQILPAACEVARKPAKACLLAQDKAPASVLGPGTSTYHRNTGAEPNTLLTFALRPDPFPQHTWTSFCTEAICHIGAFWGP